MAAGWRGSERCPLTREYTTAQAVGKPTDWVRRWTLHRLLRAALNGRECRHFQPRFDTGNGVPI